MYQENQLPHMHEPPDNFEITQRPTVPEWFVTFADMMSLLLALFVMLVSFSELKENERFEALSHTLRGQFGGALEDGSQAAVLLGREEHLAGEINAARSQRAGLLGVDLPVTIAGMTDTVVTSVTGSLPGALNDGEQTPSRAMAAAKLP